MKVEINKIKENVLIIIDECEIYMLEEEILIGLFIMVIENIDWL